MLFTSFAAEKMNLRCSQIFVVILIFLSFFGVYSKNVKRILKHKKLAAFASGIPSYTKLPAPYLKTCTMANLVVATRNYQNRYAYGLTLGCTFFFFEISEYEIFDRALDFYQSQYDLNRYTNHNGDLCPVDMFNVRYVSQSSKPYFEILELSTGTPHYIQITKQKIFFKQITPKRATSFPKSMTIGSWIFDKSGGWATHYGNLLIHSRPSVNPRSGRHEVRTFIRHKQDAFPGACIKQSFSKYHLFQIYPLTGDEAYDFENYVQHDVAIPPRVVPTEHENLEYYFFATIGVIGFGGITIFIGIGLSIWKHIKYVLLERQRYEIEKFVVACYVEKLEKISKVPKEAEKAKKSKKKKRYSPSESKSSYRHRRRHHRRRRSLSASESLSKIPHGSKIIPLPNEKDLFASDRKKAELKPAAVHEPRKDKTGRQPSKGPSQSVCSLKSVTQSLDNSLDWTGKGVRVSQRRTAYEQHKADKSKDEEDAYKLGLNLSTYKRKKKRQQHGLQNDDDLELKKTEDTQYPLSNASGMSSYTKPIAPTPPSAPSKTATATPAAPGITNSTLLRGDGKTPAQDEARYQRAEKELQDRLESEKRKREQHAAKATTAAAGGGGGGGVAGGGGAKVQLANNNPYGSLSVPLDDVFTAEKKK